MSKVNYTSLANLSNEHIATSTINTNFAAVQTAMEKTLSRDGTSPNTMSADIDMNGHHIYNLAIAGTESEFVTKEYVDTLFEGSDGAAALALKVGWLSVKDNTYGAKGDGVTDDTTAIQNALNESVDRTCYFPDGTYLISTHLTIPENTAVIMSSNCVIVANAAMDAVFITDAAAESKNNIISGGFIDCNNNADTGIWLKWFSMYRIEDVEIWDNKVYGIRLGRAAGTSSYEAFVTNTRIRRSITDTAPTGSTGIYFENCGDSHISETIIMGQKYGIAGNINDSKFDRVHCWNPQENGPLLIGFSITGGDNVLMQCQVDGDCTSNVYYLNGTRNKIIGCCANHVSWGTDNAAGLVYIEAGYKATVVGCSFKGYSGSVRWGSDFILGAGASVDWFFNDVTNTVTTHTNGIWLSSASIIDFGNGDVRLTHSSNALSFSGAANGYSFSDGPVFHSSNSVPATSDGAALGTTGFQWSDLFLASGGVIDFANGNLKLTHASGSITCSLRLVGNTVGTGVFTVATLPASPVQGDKAFVTDANATTFLSIVAGGGANKVPVVYNGTNWVIG